MGTPGMLARAPLTLAHVPFPSPQVHCNNMHTLGARLPAGVECHFKRGPAMAWEGDPVRHALGGSLGDPRARAVSVPLGGRVARFLQCRFLFAGPWLLFSEISFVSGKPGNSPGPSLQDFQALRPLRHPPLAPHPSPTKLLRQRVPQII